MTTAHSPGAPPDREPPWQRAERWHAIDGATAADQLDVRPGVGLSTEEAQRRLEQHGRNDIGASETAPWWPLLLGQFSGPLSAILIIAVLISVAIGETLDAGVIAAIVVLNGVLGFAQEWRAGKAIEALRAMLVQRARVRRDGEEAEIDAALLVPGDIVELDAGAKVPADVRLLEVAGLLVDESALTGESVPVRKQVEANPAGAPLAERTCLGYFGTEVMAGRSVAVVVATGRGTEFGTVVSLTEAAEDIEVPLQQTLAGLSRRLGVVAVAIATITVLLGIAAGRPAADMFLTGVSLAVAVVPEGLPAVVTVTLALGIRSMSRRRALLRHLEAAETLGAASVICTDKTGTLTQNRMTVRQVWTADGLVDAAEVRASDAADTPVGQLLATGQLCNNAALSTKGAIGDPTEAALLLFADAVGAVRPAGAVVREIPFDSATKIMSSVVRSPDGALWAHVKGAPEVVADRCVTLAGAQGVTVFDAEARDRLVAAQAQMASAGLRTLAFAHRAMSTEEEDVDGNLTFLGLVGMHDPPRPEVPEAVAKARAAGLDVIVMTGDAGGTALAIATEIGLPATDVLTGAELDELADDDLAVSLDGSHVLARVTPEHKMRVVKLLQSRGAVVAMTGDGVNDAPALEQASIGVAMGLRGTDVAKEAADVVLADDNFASIVAAIEEGRRQYANIQKFIRYLLSSNLGEVVAVSGCVALGWPLVLLPAQILWMNLMTDGVTALALGIEPVEPDAMDRPPRRPDASVVDKTGLRWILGAGVAIGLVALGVFRVTLGSGDGADLIRAQTLAFTAMVLLETVNVFNFRAERQSLTAVGFWTNPWLLAAALGAVAAQVGAVHLGFLSAALGTSAMTLAEWGVLVLFALPILAGGELVKWGLRRRDLKAGRGKGLRPLPVPTASS